MAIFGQVSSMLQSFLYLRGLAAAHGLSAEMSPDLTADEYWYPRRFKSGVGPKVAELIKEDAPSPVLSGGRRMPSMFVLGKLFKGASMYPDDVLAGALVELGPVEVALRGDLASEALSVWLMSFLG